ncbi:phenylacetate-CoA ligase [Raineyella antarctica]|uniref:Phenylacetate-coenzyme A ligase n=1 Tax=Raineyella antarctica TaxID=1577474 RepID=A0A1G6HG62_9ACTN|nr:phenylacetate--CoA ligase [Raineyella antarctica]SDB93239.1 phenylacetate-CoA ligase [Raineyella antarctica]
MWNDAAQRLPRTKLRELQLVRLQAQVARIDDRVPYYRERMAQAGVLPEEIKSLEDLVRLPFTSKAQLREGFPFGLSAVPRSELVEVHMSSGSTGKPVVDGYTRGDLELWGDLMGRTLDMGGVGPDDVVQNSFGYGLFTGGFGVHYGAGTIGALVLPISSGNTRRQLETMRDFGTTTLAGTPSYALYLAEYARDHGIDPRSLGLRKGFFGAEPWSEAMRHQIEEDWGIEAFDIYGLTEIIGPGVGAECPEHDGLHVYEDHFYPEVVDPETGVPVPDGTEGELVLTTLTRQGTPLLRYRTRDVTYLIDEPCRCGRTSRRIHRLMGRTDDMLIIRGVNIFPQQVEEVLLRIQGVAPHYQLVVDRHGSMDTLEVEVEMTVDCFSDDVADILALERRIEAELRSALGIQATCVLVNPKTVDRATTGKAVRTIDRREVRTHV